MKISVTQYSGGNGGETTTFEGSELDLNRWLANSGVTVDPDGVKVGTDVNGLSPVTYEKEVDGKIKFDYKFESRAYLIAVVDRRLKKDHDGIYRIKNEEPEKNYSYSCECPGGPCTNGEGDEFCANCGKHR